MSLGLVIKKLFPLTGDCKASSICAIYGMGICAACRNPDGWHRWTTSMTEMNALTGWAHPGTVALHNFLLATGLAFQSLVSVLQIMFEICHFGSQRAASNSEDEMQSGPLGRDLGPGPGLGWVHAFPPPHSSSRQG